MTAVVQTWSDDRPNAGRVFAAVFPHADDLSIFAAGTALKLLHEGYTGYLIKTTNDDKDSYDLSAAETVHRIDGEVREVVELLGLRKLYLLRLPEPPPRRAAVHRIAASAHHAVPAPARRHGHQLRPVGSLRGEPRPRDHRPGGGGRLLDGGPAARPPRARRPWPPAHHRAGQVLRRPRPAAHQPRRRHHTCRRAQAARRSPCIARRSTTCGAPTSTFTPTTRSATRSSCRRASSTTAAPRTGWEVWSCSTGSERAHDRLPRARRSPRAERLGTP